MVTSKVLSEFRLDHEQPKTSTSTRNKRQRNVIWYNPPFSKNVKTDIAREFLKLIDKHFPHTNKLHKIFYRHTVRVSYSCSENMKCFINRHNKTILKKHDRQNTTKRTCKRLTPLQLQKPQSVPNARQLPSSQCGIQC